MLPVCSLQLDFVALTFVCVGLCVTASRVFSGTEDSYTVTCGMPLPCLADAQKNNSGLYCLGKYKTSPIYIYLSALPHKTVTQEQLGLSLFSADKEVDQNNMVFCPFVLQVRRQLVFHALRPQPHLSLAPRNAI